MYAFKLIFFYFDVRNFYFIYITNYLTVPAQWYQTSSVSWFFAFRFCGQDTKEEESSRLVKTRSIMSNTIVKILRIVDSKNFTKFILHCCFLGCCEGFMIKKFHLCLFSQCFMRFWIDISTFWICVEFDCSWISWEFIDDFFGGIKYFFVVVCIS